MRFAWYLMVTGAMVALLAGCGSGDSDRSGTTSPPRRNLKEVAVSLDGYKGPENVGLLMASEKGYFEDAGLDVGLYPPLTPVRPVRYARDGTDDLAITQEPQVVQARRDGAPIVAVGSVIARPTEALIWLKRSHIDSVADLRGKTVAIPGLPFQRAYLKAVLRRAGMTLADVDVRSVGYRLVPSLVSGRADAIFGGSWNLEGVLLASRGLEPVVRPVEKLGTPRYEELVVVARSAYAKRHAEIVQKFMAAVGRGTAAAVADPDAAADVIVEAVEGNPGLSREVTEAQLRATLPLLSGTPIAAGS